MAEYSTQTDGPTPNGGDYAVAYWFDHTGAPVDRRMASQAEVVEYKRGGPGKQDRPIHHTTATVPRVPGLAG